MSGADTDPPAERITVEIERCIGGGQCVLIAPDYFDQDDEGMVVVLKETTDPGDEDLVDDAIKICPAQVIALTRP